ncbi:hypothetical protein CYMTET_32594 [Cymbomonas tetramitiformis]|uniref:Peptidase C45 hydrolase domain-containing protein n=1 Tax=Cymbomonas tetramitiformis TaxID=36881 RepID=A0AAE0FER0_9CHLO|nr:hypothetical protein CYMTET_32594 [Cymbomonas tetramitiformis]
MAAGAEINSTALLVKNFREELVQFAPDVSIVDRRVSKCSSVFVNNQHTLALGHNDDWTQNWRGLAYWVLGTETQADGTKLRFATWLYPGYLAGMDITYNSYGVVYSVNSLFPTKFEKGGLGTAFVARHLVSSTNLVDARRRATTLGVSSAISYNLGSIRERRLLELEVGTGGGEANAILEIQPGRSYFHGNEFTVLNASQYPDTSTQKRAEMWAQMQPVQNISAIRAFLGSTAGEWPVYRNHTAPDDCFTELTGNIRTACWHAGSLDRQPAYFTTT